MVDIDFSSIGEWSEIKLKILKEYAKPYSDIMKARPMLKYQYIDAFSDRGMHVSRKTREIIPGSPLNALRIEPRFPKYIFIDIQPDKVEALRHIVDIELAAIPDPKPKVDIIRGDCNDILYNDILPQITYESYNRALCFLDPYGMDLEWKVIEMAGKLKTIDLFINFPTMDMNRNALWKNPDEIDLKNIQRINRLWGGDYWRDAAYDDLNLFQFPEKKSDSNNKVAQAYGKMLHDVAGFKFIPDPVPMKNSKGATLYYLFFASQVEVAAKIAGDIFKKYSR